MRAGPPGPQGGKARREQQGAPAPTPPAAGWGPDQLRLHGKQRQCGRGLAPGDAGLPVTPVRLVEGPSESSVVVALWAPSMLDTCSSQTCSLCLGDRVSGGGDANTSV